MKLKKAFVAVIVFMLIPVSAHASSKNLADRESVFKFLEEAFQAQVSLNEKERSRDEIKKALFPYFSKEYIKLFSDENLYPENDKYITYGTDFAIYYIPFFDYSEVTICTLYEDKLYVYEYFPKTTEGPVSYEGHYEGVVLERFNESWKVTEFLYNNVPEEVVRTGENLQESAKKEGRVTEEVKELLVFPNYLFNRFIKQKETDMVPFQHISDDDKKNELLPVFRFEEDEILYSF